VHGVRPRLWTSRINSRLRYYLLPSGLNLLGHLGSIRPENKDQTQLYVDMSLSFITRCLHRCLCCTTSF
jgi:hypothetical protein